MVQVTSNDVRLAALKNKKKFQIKQSDVIKNSLADNVSNKIKKFSDSDSDDNHDISNILHDVNENEEILFAEKPFFSGKKGEKLMKLQTKIGSDNRFKLDERFESSSDDSSEEEDNEDAEFKMEREKHYHIINSVLQGFGFNKENKPERTHQIVNDFVRFDPSNADHRERFVVKPKSEMQKFHEDNVDMEADQTKKPDTVCNDHTPIVSKETFFDIKTDFNSLMSSDKSNGFVFNFAHESTENKIDHAFELVTEKLEINQPQHDSSDDEETFNIAEAEDILDTSKSLSKFRPFFYTLNLANFKHYFKRTKTMEDIEKEWLSKRQQLTLEYKKKNKDALRFQKKIASRD